MATLKGAEEFPFYFGASAETLRLAGELRVSMTPSERKLWRILRNRLMDRFRFRRQHPIKDFIVDFFCYQAMLAIEVDGSVHHDPTQRERDEERTRILNQLGIRVIRVTNHEVESDSESVLSAIRTAINNKKLIKSDGYRNTSGIKDS